MSAPHILIAGAGIGGLTAALALGRQGIGITLIERRTMLDEVGAGIQISPNASRILIELGLAGALAREAVAPERVDIRRWDRPRSYATIPMNDRSERYGAPFWVIHRADLHQTLLDAVRQLPNLRLLIGRTLESAATTQDGVTVTTRSEKGEPETLSGLALIGADGLWSAARRLSGDASAPVFTGYEAWRTLVPIGDVPAFMRQPAVGLWLGPGHHGVHYPVRGSRLLNLVVVRDAASPREGWNTPGDASQIAAFAQGACQPLRDCIAAAPSWQVWSLNDRRPATMAKGHIALLGDAAHPVLPFLAQGAALAIEDAAVLARLIGRTLRAAPAARAKADMQNALRDYDSLRRARAGRVRDEARANGRRYHLGWPLARARDLFIASRGPEAMLTRLDWLYGWRDG